MIIKELEVLNELGIHARVASRIVRCCRNFKSSIKAIKDGKEYDFKSVVGVMTVNAKCRDIVTIEINGLDEEEALQEIRHLFEIKFGEN